MPEVVQIESVLGESIRQHSRAYNVTGGDTAERKVSSSSSRTSASIASDSSASSLMSSSTCCSSNSNMEPRSCSPAESLDEKESVRTRPAGSDVPRRLQRSESIDIGQLRKASQGSRGVEENDTDSDDTDSELDVDQQYVGERMTAEAQSKKRPLNGRSVHIQDFLQPGTARVLSLQSHNVLQVLTAQHPSSVILRRGFGSMDHLSQHTHSPLSPMSMTFSASADHLPTATGVPSSQRTSRAFATNTDFSDDNEETDGDSRHPYLVSGSKRHRRFPLLKTGDYRHSTPTVAAPNGSFPPENRAVPAHHAISRVNGIKSPTHATSPECDHSTPKRKSTKAKIRRLFHQGDTTVK